MTNRGYYGSFIRDCATGRKAKKRQPRLKQTNAAILLLEVLGQYSITSDEILKGFSAQASSFER
ncbi:MAG: hypothetical protein H7069_12335 [Phormidesmis sp. FL-bin-119]|nr:hypothetical protein [Pedobacter sp.]